MLNLSCFKERYEGFESLQELENSTQTIIMQEVIIANTEGNKKGALKSKSWTMPAKMVNFYSVQTRKVNTAASLEEREIFTVQHFLNSGSLHQFWLKILESINSLALNLQDTVTIVKNHCSVRTPALHNTDIRHWIPRQSVKVLGRKPNSMGFFFFFKHYVKTPLLLVTCALKDILTPLLLCVVSFYRYYNQRGTAAAKIYYNCFLTLAFWECFHGKGAWSQQKSKWKQDSWLLNEGQNAVSVRNLEQWNYQTPKSIIFHKAGSTMDSENWMHTTKPYSSY